MLTFADGYNARIDSWHITETYGELIIGRPKYINEAGMMERINRSMVHIWGTDRPWYLMPRCGSNGINRRHIVYLWLISELIPDVDDCFCGSYVFIAMNIDYDHTKTLIEQVQPLVAELKWADIAKNWDM